MLNELVRWLDMRLLFACAFAAGCTLAPTAAPPPSSTPTTAPAVAPPPAPPTTCPPLGTWTVDARATCDNFPRTEVFTVHAGPPDANDPIPMFDVTAPVASGRTTLDRGPERLLRVSDARTTSAGCEMQLQVEYVGPHEAIEYKALVTYANGRVRGSGTYAYMAEDCEEGNPYGRECTCDSTVAIDATVRS